MILPVTRGGRRDHVKVADLEAFLPADKAAAALASLDLDRDGVVSLQDMRDAVLQACAFLPSPPQGHPAWREATF